MSKGFKILQDAADDAAKIDHNDQPLTNRAMEDLLAHAVTEEERIELIAMWMMLGAEYLARNTGRSRARAEIQWLDEWIRDAQPAKPWRP